MAETSANVLLLTGRFEVRGSSLYTLRLAEHLAEYGFAAHIACSDCSRVDKVHRNSLNIREYSYLDQPFVGQLVLEWLWRDLADSMPDIIHIQSRKLFKQGLRLARMLDKPCLITLHDFQPVDVRLKTEDVHVITISNAIKQELLQKAGLPEKQITVVHPGVKVQTAATVAAVLDPEHRPVIGMAGPLETVKGIRYFLQATKEVLETYPHIEILIAGAGPEELSLRNYVKQKQLTEHVTFASNLFDFTASLTAIDIFCLPSLEQGLGTIMLEAMALGKPVIASSVGGVNSVIQNGETGLVVEAADSSQLKERILELLDDPLRARSIGEAGRQMVQERFSIEKMIRTTTNLYRNLLAAKGAVVTS